MPPKVKFTREEIVNAAVNVARVKGAAAVTTRDIAAELKVSTRPIFTYFNTMDQVKAEIRLAAESIYQEYAREGLKMDVPFLGVGTQHIRFAREEPELYKLLFLTPPVDEGSGAMAAMRQTLELVRPSLQRIYRIDAATADIYFRNMWLVVHSLATLIVTGDCPYSDQELSDILTQFSVSTCKACKELPGFTDVSFDRDELFGRIVNDG